MEERPASLFLSTSVRSHLSLALSSFSPYSPSVGAAARVRLETGKCSPYRTVSASPPASGGSAEPSQRDRDFGELGKLGLLMKCSLRRRRRRGPAVGARPPARNNNAAEVKRGVRRAIRGPGMSPFSARCASGPAVVGAAAAQRAWSGGGGRGRAGAVQFVKRCRLGDSKSPIICPVLQQLRNPNGQTLPKPEP